MGWDGYSGVICYDFYRFWTRYLQVTQCLWPFERDYVGWVPRTTSKVGIRALSYLKSSSIIWFRLAGRGPELLFLLHIYSVLENLKSYVLICQSDGCVRQHSTVVMSYPLFFCLEATVSLDMQFGSFFILIGLQSYVSTTYYISHKVLWIFQVEMTSIVLKKDVTMLDIQSTRMLGQVGFLAKVSLFCSNWLIIYISIYCGLSCSPLLRHDDVQSWSYCLIFLVLHLASCITWYSLWLIWYRISL